MGDVLKWVRERVREGLKWVRYGLKWRRDVVEMW